MHPLGPVQTFVLAAMLFTLRETKQRAPAAVGETDLSVFPPTNNVCASAENQVFAEMDGKFQPCVFHNKTDSGLMQQPYTGCFDFTNGFSKLTGFYL